MRYIFIHTRRLVWLIIVEVVYRLLKAREFFVVRAARAGRVDLDITINRPLLPGRVAIFATWPNIAPEPGLHKFIRALDSAGVQIVAVANCRLPEDYARTLREHCSVVIAAPNIGRDFGAYQIGVRFVQKALGAGDLERLIMFNDSIYFFDNVDHGPLVEALVDSTKTYVGAFENFHGEYHVGSFMFAIDGKLAQAASFTSFWENYLPYSNRRHAIQNGEIAISRKLITSGNVAHIVYPVELVFHHLISSDLWKTVDLNSPLLSLGARSRIKDLIQERSSTSATITAAMLPALSEFYQNNNQSHNLGLAAAALCGCPFMKKDLVKNGIALLSDIYSLNQMFHLESTDYYRASFQTRGTRATHMGLRSRLRDAVGL